MNPYIAKVVKLVISIVFWEFVMGVLDTYETARQDALRELRRRR